MVTFSEQEELMIPPNVPPGYSVTLKSKRGLVERPWLFFQLLTGLEPLKPRAEDELKGLKNLTASLCNSTVKKVLSFGQASGMKQRDFEEQARCLRPPRKRTVEGVRLGGRLWNHYMKKKSTARMTTLTMLEYLSVFHEKGWIGDQLAADCFKLCLAVELLIMTKGSRTTATEHFIRHFLKTRYGLDNRTIGNLLKAAKAEFDWNPRAAKAGCSKECDCHECLSELAYREWLEALPPRLLGMESFAINLKCKAALSIGWKPKL